MKKSIHKLICLALTISGLSFYACQQDECVEGKQQQTLVKDAVTEARNDDGSLYCNVTTTAAGQVDSLIAVRATEGDYPRAGITHLTVSGPINNDDILHMCYYKYLDSLVLTNAVIEKIENVAFREFKSKAHIMLPKTLKEIENQAFGYWYESQSHCQAKSIYMEDSVETIGSNAFAYCTMLENVRLSKKITKIEPQLFRGCYKLKEIEIPKNVKEMSYEVFQFCSSLKKVVLSDHITEMNVGVFAQCSSLDSINWPKYLPYIPDRTFEGCSNIKFEIPKSVESIGGYAFKECTNITEYKIPEHVESIGTGAFASTGITSLTLTPETLLSDELFKNCPITSLIIQEGVTTLPQYIFSECNKLESVKFPSSLKEIGNGAFENCNLKSVELGKEIETMGYRIFCSNKSMKTARIYVKNIGNQAFQSCDNLEEVVVGEGVETIGNSAFSQTKVKEVNFPSTLMSIGSMAFYETPLTKIEFPVNLKNIGEYAFHGCVNLGEVNWNEGLETIAGAAFTFTSLSEFVAPSSLKTIGHRAFQDIKTLETIVLNEGLTTIGQNAFINTPIKTIVIPSTIESCGWDLFSGCSNLTSIYWKSQLSAPRFFDNADKSNILLYLTHGNSSNENPNQIVNGKSQNTILLRSAGNFHCPESFVSDMQYDRVFNRRYDNVSDYVSTEESYDREYSFQNLPGQASCWQTIVLPFEVTSIKCGDKELVPFGAEKEGAYPFWLRELTPNGFVRATKIEANKPYIIAMPNNEAYADEYNIRGKVSFYAENVTIPVTEELKEVQGPKFNFYPTYTWLGKNAERLVLNRINEYYDSKQGVNYYYGSAFVPNQYDLGSFGAYVSSPVGGRSVVPIESALSSRRTHKLGPIPQENDM